MFLTTGNTASWTVGFLGERWDYFNMRDGGQGHISFFNPASISRIAMNVGFEVKAIESRRVKTVLKGKTRGVKYALGKLAQELLSAPAKLLNKGHDMMAVLRKP